MKQLFKAADFATVLKCCDMFSEELCHALVMTTTDDGKARSLLDKEVADSFFNRFFPISSANRTHMTAVYK